MNKSNTIIFDGVKLAQEHELKLAKKVSILKKNGKHIKIAAILFEEDLGSALYSNLKKEAAQRVGISYELHIFSVKDPIDNVKQKIALLNMDETITGIIIQKPWRKTWIDGMSEPAKDYDITRSTEILEPKTKEDFNNWWKQLTSSINESKDIDGLHLNTLLAIKDDTWQEKGKVLPATCKAVLSILAESGYNFYNNIIEHPKVVILGTSDLLGKPLYYMLKNKDIDVENIGTKGLNTRIEEEKYLKDADVIVTATGRKHLITGDMVKEEVVVIDVGEPYPDVEYSSVVEKASFITPVPGGVGPMTVVSLLENGVELVRVE